MPAEPSFHPPPAPQLTPARSPLLIAVIGKEPLYSDEAEASPPFAGNATFVRSDGGGPGVAEGVGVGVGVGDGVGPAEPPQASTSVIRLYPASELLICTLILSVEIAEKVTLFQTLLFEVMLPLGTVIQADPFQYWISNDVTPYWVNVSDNVGSDGFEKLSWIVNTLISSIVLVPLKSICSKSAYEFQVSSFQPPPFPQFKPFRSPFIAATTGKAAEYSDEEVAAPPFDASAKFVLSPDDGVGVGVGEDGGEEEIKILGAVSSSLEKKLSEATLLCKTIGWSPAPAI